MHPLTSRAAAWTLSAAAIFITPFSATRAQAGRSPLSRIPWADGPVTGSLGLEAEVGVPASCRFADPAGAKTFMEVTRNPTSGNEVGVILCKGPGNNSAWFVVFSFEKSGYVKDDEKGKLDAAKILKAIQEGTEEGNSERRRRGWEELEVIGWERAPFYDAVTHNLTWSTKVKAKGAPGMSINHSVRLLGRRGVMHADLVADPADLASAVTDFGGILTQFNYVAGQKYSEWKSGDKIAEYGLTALIAGGAGAAAVKLGLFGKMWKAILAGVLALKKLIIVIIAGIGAFLKKVFGKKEPKVVAVVPPRPARGPAGGAASSVRGPTVPPRPPGGPAAPPRPPGGPAAPPS